MGYLMPNPLFIYIYIYDKILTFSEIENNSEDIKLPISIALVMV